MKEIKISKLFHLLYATLLLAPVFAVGVSCAQTAFTGTGLSAEANVFYTDTNTVHETELKTDVWYVLDCSKSNTDWGEIDLYTVDVLFWEYSVDIPPTYIRNIDVLGFNYDQSQGMSFRLESFNIVFGDVPYFSFNNWPIFAFRYKNTFEPIRDITFPIRKDYSLAEQYLPLIAEEKGYQDIFYSSVDTVAHSPFFNWAEKSFLGEGFRYMGNIFGMPTDNPFYTFTCYWCAISILWLIFDVVMYVPKLAHRWLDKGAIE